MKLTRRQLASTLGAGAALAQTPARSPSTPEIELQAARDRVKANVDRLAAEPVPMTIEPAFQFRP
jgi:hypothetical protein